MTAVGELEAAGRFGREEAGARREVEAQPEPAPQPLGWRARRVV